MFSIADLVVLLTVLLYSSTVLTLFKTLNCLSNVFKEASMKLKLVFFCIISLNTSVPSLPNLFKPSFSEVVISAYIVLLSINASFDIFLCSFIKSV